MISEDGAPGDENAKELDMALELRLVQQREKCIWSKRKRTHERYGRAVVRETGYARNLEFGSGGDVAMKYAQHQRTISQGDHAQRNQSTQEPK